MATAVTAVITRIGEIASKLKVIVGARLSAAAESIAARVPALADDTGSISFAKLGVWSKGWSVRGLEIETKLGGNLPRSFPVIDRFDRASRTVTSIKSVDMAAPGYQSAGRLSSRLKSYVDKVAGFNGRTFDGVSITARQVQVRELQVAVQPGVTSLDQQAVFDQMISYGRSKGVHMYVTEVP